MAAKTPAPLHDPKAVFYAGVCWEHTAQSLAKISTRTLQAAVENKAESLFHSLIPGLVVSAFSLELYFKCLIRMETGANAKFGHKLANFFNDDLRQETQKRIRAAHANLRATDPHLKAMDAVPELAAQSAFDVVMTRSSNVFEKWRYYYELPKGDPVADPQVIRVATRLVILEDHPEWSHVAEILDK